MNEQKRWYDKNKTLSTLISHLEDSVPEKQKYIAKTIIKMSKQENITVDPPTAYVRNLRRKWYDWDETVSLSMEYLKSAPEEIQSKIAGKILYNMKKIDRFIEENFDSLQIDEEKIEESSDNIENSFDRQEEINSF